MDVNLPDGRVLRNVPDGTTQAQILAKLRAAGEDVSWADQKQPTGAEIVAKEQGPMDALAIGAGKKTSDILNGLAQMYLSLRGEPKALEGLKQNVATENAAYAPLRAERPYATGFGEALPSMAVPGAGSGYVGAAVAGALPDLLSYGSTEQRLAAGGVGAAGGMAGRAAGGLLSNILKPAGVGVNPNRAAIDAAERIGYKPLAGAATQNPAMMNVENYLSRGIGSSGIMQGLERANKEAVGRAAASSIGEVSNNVSADVLKAAESRIGSSFERLQAITAPHLGDDFVNALATIEAKNASLGPFRLSSVDSVVQKGLDLAAKGDLSGEAYKVIRTEISNQATSAFKSGDAAVGQAFKAVRNALDDAATKSLAPEEQKAWQVAREQWGNWKTLTKGLLAEGGDVSPARVAQALRAQGPGFRTGTTTGPLADVGRIGEGIKSALNPNSGNLQNVQSYGSMGVPLAIGNFAAAKVYTNPIVQKYLREGLLDIGKNGELIVKATGVPLGAAATKGLLGVD